MHRKANVICKKEKMFFFFENNRNDLNTLNLVID